MDKKPTFYGNLWARSFPSVWAPRTLMLKTDDDARAVMADAETELEQVQDRWKIKAMN